MQLRPLALVVGFAVALAGGSAFAEAAPDGERCERCGHVNKKKKKGHDKKAQAKRAHAKKMKAHKAQKAQKAHGKKAQVKKHAPKRGPDARQRNRGQRPNPNQLREMMERRMKLHMKQRGESMASAAPADAARANAPTPSRCAR